jgi:glycosyltransferase involved in cell wall biosynthesis
VTARRVVHVIHDLRAGGAERRMVAVLAALDRRRFEPVVCCINRLGDLEAEVRALGIDPVVLGRRRRSDVSGIGRLARLVRRERADVVHGWLFLANVYARVGGLLGGASAVVVSEGGAITTLDGRRALRNARAERLLAPLSDAAVANSETVADALRRVGLPERQLVVIHNGVAIPEPLSAERRDELRASVGASHGDRLVGMVARLDGEFKDHETFLRAAARVRADHQQLHVVVVGEGPARQRLDALARKLGLEQAVVFTGYRQDARELSGALDLSVLLTYSEGFSNVVLESMAWGLPLVTTDIAANREAAGDAAVLVPVRDVDATAAAISRLLDDPAAARALGALARERAATFSLEAQGEKTMELYERLLARKGRR